MSDARRYAGRAGGPGVHDDLSGPATISALFEGTGVVIDDPVSFPWHLTGDAEDREPLLVDLRGCSSADMTALGPALAVLTRSDRVIATDLQRADLSDSLALPGEVFLDAPPENPGELLEQQRADKLVTHLLRDGLAPILERELGIDPDLPPQRVHQVGGDDTWLRSIVPGPHRFARSDRLADTHPECAEVVLLDSAAIELDDLETAVRAIVPGGLIVFLLDATAVRSAEGLTMAGLVAALTASFGSQFVFEHVWGLHEEPGRPTLGAIVAIRPLGGREEAR